MGEIREFGRDCESWSRGKRRRGGITRGDWIRLSGQSAYFYCFTFRNHAEERETQLFFSIQVAHLYPSITHALPSLLSNLLLSSAPAASASVATVPIKSTGGATATVGVNGGGVQLSPEVRKTMMQGLVLLRRRDVITGVESVFPFFCEFRC